MNQRAEPRFKTDTRVTLQFASEAEPVPARMVDVSGLGFRLLVEQPIAVGEALQINVEDRRLLVSVRHCGPTDNGYFVGVERIDKWLPGEADGDEAVLGRPQVKKSVDPLRAMALRNQFSKQSAGTDRRRGMMLGGIGAVIGLGVLALIFGGVRGSGHTSVSPPVAEKEVEKTEPVAKKKPVAKKAGIPVAKPVTARSKPQPAPSGPLQVRLHASGLSWVDACADGKLVISKALNAGETSQIKFVNVATVRSGNAGGIEITFGSKPAERMGEEGLIQMWKFTPQGHQDVPPNSASACTVH